MRSAANRLLADRIEARSMSAGRTNPALAGSGVGCGLAGRTRPVAHSQGAASWPSPHMSKSHSFFGPPPFRVPLTYARARVGSTDFAQVVQARCASSYETQLRASGIARRRAEEEGADTLYRLRATTKSADPKRDARAAMKPSCERRESRAAVLRRREQTRFIVCERRRSRRDRTSAMREQL